MDGLYALKPWYSDRLTRVRTLLVARRTPPSAVSAAGTLAGAGAGTALALLPTGPVCALAVGGLLALRLACANLDGAVARQAGTASRAGSVINELSDRLAELAALAGCLALAAPAMVAATALAASGPSWVSLAGAAAGAPRIAGGPVGKTERCLLLVVVAATGWAVPVLALLAVGSLLTCGFRLARLRTELVARPC